MPITKIPSAGFSDAVNFRNILINGDMSIAQRGTSSSSVSTAGYHSVDRFRIALENAGTFTVSQSTDVPTGQGFQKSFKLDCTTADTSLVSGAINTFEQRIEGQNLVYLKKGTSNAESVTVSFWVKTNKTGTYVFELIDNDNSRHIAKTFTVDSSSTWEKKTLTFAGDTSGALTYDNSTAMTVRIWLSAGSSFQGGTLPSSWVSASGSNRAVGQTVNIADSTDNEWYITGVQLEAGQTASEFEFLPYDVNLNRCLRYFYNLIDRPGGDSEGYFAAGYMYSGDRLYFQIPFFVEMRATPTMSAASGTDYYTFYRDSAGDNFNEILTTQLRKNYAMLRAADSHISGTAGQAGGVHTTSNSKVTFSAEL